MKITEESVHAALDPIVSDLSFSQWERQRMVYVAMASEREKRRKPTLLRRMLATAVAAAICLTASMAVLASPALSDKLGMVGQKTRDLLTPTNASCENNGIRLEVLASMHDEDTVVSYISLEDTTGQRRLDDTVTLCDLRIDGEPTVISDYPVVQEDGSVVVRVQGLRDPLQSAGGKVSLSMKAILSGGVEKDYQDTGITVADIVARSPSPAMVGSVQIGDAECAVQSGALDELMRSYTMQGLKAVAEYETDKIPFLTFLNAGMVDNNLHILVRQNPEYWYNNCDFALFDAEGNPIAEDVAKVCIGKKMSGVVPDGKRIAEKMEYILSLPKQQALEDLHLYYSVAEYKHCATGQWNVTFDVPEEKHPTIWAACNLDMKPWRMKAITVSPFGYEALGTGTLLESSTMPDVAIYLQDGTVIDGFSSCISTVQTSPNEEEDQISVKCYFDEPLNADEVVKVTVCGETVWQRR